MVIKGGSRAGPKQLAKHLLRADTNERVEIVELHSPIEDLHETFRDWQVLASGTRGSKGLYHANIDPAKGYEMTGEQWLRSADVLEEHLGLQGQPRAVVLHEKHGRQHIHVVWQRTDVDEMKMVPDSYNYLAHEKASFQLEQEFGHEHVPGKHAKRNREKQPEFPKADINHAEWQQKERTGVDPRARKDLIKNLYEASDSAHAFKAAVEHEGYMLAQGDRRDFVLVDTHAQIHSLSRQIKGVSAKELREFMTDIDPTALPDVAEAIRVQTELAADRAQQQALVEKERAERQRVDQDNAAKEKAPQEKQALEQSAETPAPEKPAALEQDQQPPAALSPEERQRFQQLLAERQAADLKKLREAHDAEARQTQGVLDRELREKMDHFDAMQAAERNRFLREKKDQQARDDLTARLRDERQTYFVTLKQERNNDIDNLVERQANRVRDEQATQEEERDRYGRDDDAARRLLDDLENARKRLEEELARSRDGPDLGPTR